MKLLILFLLLLPALSNDKNRNIPAPEGLTVCLLRAPNQAVVTNPNPSFGWIFPREGTVQRAYQILVASSPDLLSTGKADLWNSGKINTSQSINIKYKGKNLNPDSAFWWRVKVWSKDNRESDFSKPQKFITGNFNKSGHSWPGQSNWIEAEPGKWVAEDRQMASFSRNEPVLMKKTGAGSWFADFGKAAFATLELSVTTPDTDDSLTVFPGERKNEDYSVHKNPGRSNIGFYKHSLPLQKGTHTYLIEIPFHDARYPHSQKLAPFYPEVLPFRYVETTGSDDISINSITRLSLFYYFDDEASGFSCSDENLNKVWDLCKYTLKATPFLGVYCDGNRERMPYEADAYIQQLGHYSVDREYSAARYTTAFLLSHASWPTEWQMHTVMMAREHYMYTGDTSFLAMVYDDLKKKTLIGLAHENGLISTRTGKVTPEFLESIHLNRDMTDIVDWPAGTPAGQKQAGSAGPLPEGERDGYVFTDFNTVVNSFHFHSLRCMSEIAEALGKEEDQKFFNERAEKVRKAIMENMFDETRGIFTDGIGTGHGSLHANMFPLAFNLVPQKNIQSVTEYIKTRGMACSVYGAQYLLEALYNTGEARYALDLMTAETKRSWMNMLNVGSTMTTEAWDEYYKPNLTWNHAWGAAPANIIARRMMGIQPLEPGFGSFVINPQPGYLNRAEIKMPVIRGTILCNLTNNEGEWEMEVSVPGNCRATVLFPANLNNIKVNGKKVKTKITNHYYSGEKNLINLKSGDFIISAKQY